MHSGFDLYFADTLTLCWSCSIITILLFFWYIIYTMQKPTDYKICLLFNITLCNTCIFNFLFLITTSMLLQGNLTAYYWNIALTSTVSLGEVSPLQRRIPCVPNILHSIWSKMWINVWDIVYTFPLSIFWKHGIGFLHNEVHLRQNVTPYCWWMLIITSAVHEKMDLWEKWKKIQIDVTKIQLLNQFLPLEHVAKWFSGFCVLILFVLNHRKLIYCFQKMKFKKRYNIPAIRTKLLLAINCLYVYSNYYVLNSSLK